MHAQLNNVTGRKLPVVNESWERSLTIAVVRRLTLAQTSWKSKCSVLPPCSEIPAFPLPRRGEQQCGILWGCPTGLLAKVAFEDGDRGLSINA